MELRIESIGATTRIYTETIAPSTVNNNSKTDQTSFQEKLDSEIEAAASTDNTATAASSQSTGEASASENSTGSSLLDNFFKQASDLYRIDEGLLKAVGKVESSFNANSVSSSGAMGIMQLMPGTAQAMGVTNAFDPQQNILGGAKYLRELLNRYNGDISLSLAAYNAGPGNVDKAGGIPISAQGYVDKVMSYFKEGVTIPQSASDAIASAYSSNASTTASSTANTPAYSEASKLTDAELQRQLETLLYEYSRRDGGRETLTKILNGTISQS